MKAIIPLFFPFFVACTSAQGSESDHATLSSRPCGSSVVNILEAPHGAVNFTVGRRQPESSDIYINSNFFDSRGPIGELIIKGKRVSSRTKGGGYFFVKGGLPGVSAYVPPKGAEYSSQSILVAVNDGKINTALLSRSHAKEPTYRSLVGADRDGKIFFLASGRGCLISISEMISFSKEFNLQDAILPDAGSSVDYKFSDGYRSVSMKALPGSVKKIMKIEEPKSYIVGRIVH